MALDFFAGCVGGVAGVIVGHPFDTVKVHLQTQDTKNPLYNGTWDCMRKLFLSHGFVGLYRGITSPMMGIGLINAIVFGVYGNVLRLYDDSKSLYGHTIAGAVAGILQSVVSSPIELTKTRMQLQHLNHSKVRHKGPLQCYFHILRTEGFAASMSGLTLTVARDIPGFTMYFVSYEYLMQLSPSPGALHNLIAGGIAGMCSWIVCYPIDVVKTCIQADLPGPLAKYKGTMDCIRKEYMNEGITFFFRGLNSTMIRAFPMNAATFFVVALVLRLFKNGNVDLVLNDSHVSNISQKDRNLPNDVSLVDIKTNNNQFSYFKDA